MELNVLTLARVVFTTYLSQKRFLRYKCLNNQPRILDIMPPRREQKETLCGVLAPIFHEFEILLGPNFYLDAEGKGR